MMNLKQRYLTPGGYREVFLIAFPLIISSSSWCVQQFVDRIFLTWYAPEAVAAALPSGILNFTLICFFLGIASYVSTFVAQYEGAGQHHMIARIVWQGLYVAFIGGVILWALIPAAPFIFRMIGHEPKVAHMEVVFFQYLCLGSGCTVATAALASFFSGIGKTKPVMWANVTATATNCFLDYILIFGNLGFERMGIKGAGIATSISAVVNILVYVIYLYRPNYRTYFSKRGVWRFDFSLFRRLIHFGAPAGLQFFVDVAGFAIFLLLVGRLGMVQLAATNIAFNINTIAFMPMLGMGIAVSVLVGQYLGKNRTDLASKSVSSGLHLTMIYMGLIALLYIVIPHVFLMPYMAHANAATFAPIESVAVILLRFVAFYSLFDAINIIYASALKGAGDTRFIMIVTGLLIVFGFVGPTWTLLYFGKATVYSVWFVATFYISALALIFLMRYRQGKWKSMRVIGETLGSTVPRHPEVPVLE